MKKPSSVGEAGYCQAACGNEENSPTPIMRKSNYGKKVVQTETFVERYHGI